MPISFKVLTKWHKWVKSYPEEIGTTKTLTVKPETAGADAIIVRDKDDTVDRFKVTEAGDVTLGGTVNGVTVESHASRHGSGGADPVTIDASQVGSGRLSLSRLPDGTAGKVLIAQGAGADPIWGDPIPYAEDESGSFTYTVGDGTGEIDVSSRFTTPLTGTTRRKYTVWFDVW